MQPDEVTIPNMSYLPAAAQENYGLAPTPRLSQTTRVEPTNNVVDVIDVDDDGVEDLSSEVVHKVEAVPANENDQPKND